MKTVIPLIALLLSLPLALAAKEKSRTLLPWETLRNPVLQYDDWSIKDATFVYRGGVFYLFTSAFYEEEGRVRCHVAEVSTRDFRSFSKPLLNFYGREDGWIGMCSPDVFQVGETYYLTFNSWGDKREQPNQLFFMTSKDLKHWTERRPLAANLTAGKRSIDAAATFANGRFYLIWKDGQQTRLATGRGMEGDFSFIGDGSPKFRRNDGAAALWHENYQFIRMKGHWHVLTTSDNHQPFLYRLEKDHGADLDWLSWVDGVRLNVTPETFNTDNRANAAALGYWPRYDDHFYLLYAGRTEKKSFLGRGWNRLGLSRSVDLVNWTPAGQVEAPRPAGRP